MAHLFDPITIRGVTLRNRIGVSPMCQYSAEDGHPGRWHVMHLGARAAGGAGLVHMEATAVTPQGRISAGDTGLYSDAHIPAFAEVAQAIATMGAVPAIQLAHAGRKASAARPWQGDHSLADDEGGWPIVAPSALAYGAKLTKIPTPLTIPEIESIVEAFGAAALRARKAGFRWLEIHGGHGYLIHTFLSPLSNQRTDSFGGSFENRTRMLLQVVAEIRRNWSDDLPLAVRLSCVDWFDNGWAIEDTIALARLLGDAGVDLIDCSSSPVAAGAKIPVGAGFQVPFADAVRRATGIPTAAVGFITEPMQADEIVRNGRADIVLMARELLRNPNWPIQAATALGHLDKISFPVQYEHWLRGRPAFSEPPSGLTRETLGRWIDGWFDAWQTRDADRAAALFTPDAVYADTPFTTWRGEPQIRDYWSRIGDLSGLLYDYEILGIQGFQGVFRFTAAFTQEGKLREVSGVATASFAEDSRCRNFSEWWTARDMAKDSVTV
jgi:2,4-dienoyl-CoA reductase-like NADH-dependent reductase (Old Yellow Enzyme family)